jgi:antitoxin MazE
MNGPNRHAATEDRKSDEVSAEQARPARILLPISPGYTLFLSYIFAETMRLAKWGNSLAVRLPASVVDALELKEGDEIEIHVADAREFGVSRKPGREELLKRLRAFRGRLPADFKFDRDEANAR